jgi:ubiquinone/menaquinone biosynthesis C-methylase UbiE
MHSESEPTAEFCPQPKKELLPHETDDHRFSPAQTVGLDFKVANYPFSDKGRDASRLLFDFSVAAACFLPQPPNKKILDFACGTGWTSELLNKLGYGVYAFDTDAAAIEMAKNRAQADKRIDVSRLHFQVGNGHEINFPDKTFGHVFCFDSLHHMADYEKVFLEVHRVLCTGGRAIFIEPGSRHSKSPETIRFLKEFPKDESWIERDVDLGEVSALASKAGFVDMRIKPFLLPANVEFSYADWYNILENPTGVNNFIQELRRFNWEDRVIFHITRR